MDRISKMLNISKKTLYKHFKDKNDIVCTLMNFQCKSEKYIFKQITNKADNAIEETFNFSRFVTQNFKDVNPIIFSDIENYHPDALKIMNNHKRVDIYNIIKSNMERGIKEELYRSDFNIDILSKIYSEKIEILYDTVLFPDRKYTFREKYEEMMMYHLHGIVSEKGLEYIRNRNTNKNNK